ncbi:MAG: hypothetical protein ACXW2Y_08105, partial [Acidimicrobiia bacterium]
VSATDQATANHTADCPPDLAALAALLHRRKPMWLIRDSRDGAIYYYDGIFARHLDAVELDLQKNFMGQVGIDNRVWDGQNYLVDRLRERSLIVG